MTKTYIGHGLIVQHFRENEQCGVLKEMKPIDENRKYDFNYQQFTYLVTIKVYVYSMISTIFWLQGDTIQLKCLYQSTGINNVTLVILITN